MQYEGNTNKNFLSTSPAKTHINNINTGKKYFQGQQDGSAGKSTHYQTGQLISSGELVGERTHSSKCTHMHTYK